MKWEWEDKARVYKMAITARDLPHYVCQPSNPGRNSHSYTPWIYSKLVYFRTNSPEESVMFINWEKGIGDVTLI